MYNLKKNETRWLVLSGWNISQPFTELQTLIYYLFPNCLKEISHESNYFLWLSDKGKSVETQDWTHKLKFTRKR